MMVIIIIITIASHASVQIQKGLTLLRWWSGDDDVDDDTTKQQIDKKNLPAWLAVPEKNHWLWF